MNNLRSLIPSRRSPFGPIVSTDHTVVEPSGFFTSKWNQAWGLVQSIFLSTPSRITFLVTSNCAWTARWAFVAVPQAKPRATSATKSADLRIRSLLRMRRERGPSRIDPLKPETSLTLRQLLGFRKDHVRIGPAFGQRDIQDLVSFDLMDDAGRPISAGVVLVESILPEAGAEARVRRPAGFVVRIHRRDLLGSAAG